MYSSAIVAQKNDIVALLNEDYNGGYIFYGYQWFRNDLPMPGDTMSYVIVSDEDQGAKYYCMLISDDGTVIETCPIWYTSAFSALESVNTLSVEPRVVAHGGMITLNRGGVVRVIDALGRQVQEYRLPTMEQNVIQAPAVPGIYMVVVGNEAEKIMVY